MTASDTLKDLGFTDYEARAYLSLLRGGRLSGYEIARDSGIPRANVYAVIDRLLQRGILLRAQDPKGARYAAVPPETLLQHLSSERERAIAAARDSLRALAAEPPPQAVYNLDAEALLAHARRLVDGCGRRLLVGVQPAEAAELAAALRGARERGVEITTLCLEACAHECGGCQGDIHRHALAPGDGRRWLLLVADEREALVAECRADGGRAVLTRQPLVVELAAAYIRQSLALALTGNALAGRFEGLLSAQARETLDRLQPGGDFLGWLESLNGAAAE